MDFTWTASGAAHAGAAKRRRERRLRAYLRYARMSVAMALAESNHHAAPRGQNMARVEDEGHEEKHNAPRRRTPPPPQRPRADAGTQTGDDAEHTAQVVASPVPQDLKGLDIEYVAWLSAWRPHLPLPMQRLTQWLSTWLQHLPSPLRHQLQ